MSVLIVGASLAGLRTAEALRAREYDEPITLVGAEAELPYDRPPLSKEYLAPGQAAPVPLLRAADAYDELNVELRLNTSATALDPAAQRVTLSDGDTLSYDKLVIACGANARSLPMAAELEGFLTLRTVADADTLRAGLDQGPKVVVLGAGFIGAEVAAAARNRGLEVDLVEMLPAPMSAALGDKVGEVLGRMHRDNGVRVHCGVTLTGAEGDRRVEAVELSDGSRLRADVVVTGLGVQPATAWLTDSGLDVTDGVACEADLKAKGRPDIFAVGDVARWTHPIFDTSVRVEHWTNANEHADIVASAITGQRRIADGVPYVWSDQYGQKIQIVGRPTADDDLTLIEDPAGGKHMAIYERAGRVVGMLTIDAPKTMLRGRKAIASKSSAPELLAGL
jgi:NADPH-dependent 2,4-dienoyl-CoA reductase/sulfur reductase-like enzyme